MPPKNYDLHGHVPDTAAVALLLIDFINDFEFEDGKALLQHAWPVAKRTAALKHRARDAAIPVIYVNDNFGKWQSNFSKLITHCLEDNVRGRPIVELLQPTDDDYFVLKPKQSGFYASTLDILLDYLQVETLIIAGVAGNICVLFTAHDPGSRGLTCFLILGFGGLVLHFDGLALRLGGLALGFGGLALRFGGLALGLCGDLLWGWQ
jgi:nicotinamidase-related amidase